MASSVSTFYLRPSNIGLSHITTLASVYALWRIKSLEITIYPTSGGYATACSYSSYRAAASTSVADMSQQDAFCLITSGESIAKSIRVNHGALRRAMVAPWCFTNTSLSPSDQGLVSLYTSAATGYYQIRGVIEFAAPLKSGVLFNEDSDSKDDFKSGPSDVIVTEPTPTPVDPPNPQGRLKLINIDGCPVVENWIPVKPPLKRQ